MFNAYSKYLCLEGKSFLKEMNAQNLVGIQ